MPIDRFPRPWVVNCRVLLVWGLLAVTAAAQTTPPYELRPVDLQMIRDAAVHQELDLTEPQLAKLQTLLDQIDPPWFRSRNQPPAQRREVVAEAQRRLARWVAGDLKSDQSERFAQLQRQALGTRMFVRPDVVDRLGLSGSQTDRLIELYQSTDTQNASLSKQLQNGEVTAAEASSSQSKLQQAERTGVMQILTDRQKSQIGPLTGEPFRLSAIRRTYPRAPNIQTEGAQWIQGGPIDLADQRGKVVALHFYAYQCINCIRNLPHYSAWHKDYADKGLVVIGIQTPETPSERKFDSVAAAVARQGITYPVVLDTDSKSWSAYANTMWPTVYLIDKDGYLRRWWQGELNWQGGNGEQQLRQTIETLLTE